MEHIRAIPDGEWNPLAEICSEQANFMAELHGNCSFPITVPTSSNFAVSSTFWPGHEPNLYIADNNLHCASGSHHFHNDNLMPMDCHSDWTHVFAANFLEGDGFLNLDTSNDSTESNDKSECIAIVKNSRLGKEVALPNPELLREDGVDSGSRSKKRSRSHEASVNERNMKFKKCPPKFNDCREDNKYSNNKNSVIPWPSSNNCFSEDDSNASHETKDNKAPNKHGKARAGRGSATDPQSLYARKRRERINERLKILQSLVPNGTKVDISTMLEEAVQYVKFLQLQIKMLSSDEMWMYAPIAYNGMDIGGLIK